MKIHKLLLTLGFAGALALMPHQAQAANLLSNPDFSQNSGTTPASPLSWATSPAAAGSCYAFGPGVGGFAFGANGACLDTISQSFFDQINSPLCVTFGLCSGPSANNDFHFLFNGVCEFALHDQGTCAKPVPGNFSFVATGHDTLTFSGRDPGSFILLSNVVANGIAAGAPEPSVAWLLPSLIGAALLRKTFS